MTDLSLIKADELTKPATVLIEKISQAVGGIFKPHQIIRVAKAEAEADRIRTESKIQVTEIQKRAMHRFLVEEGRKQANIEEITRKALPLLNDESSPQNIADDWITNFFDKSRIVSDADVQQLWSRVLAGEANTPGSFSRQTVNLLSNFEKKDAELFTALCGFGWMIGNVVPLVFDVQANIYNLHGINFNSLSHLDSLGLVKFEPLAGFLRAKLTKKTTAFYYGSPVNLTFPNDEDNQLEIGRLLLTSAGQQLAPVCGSKPVDGFLDYVCERWRSKNLIAEDPTSGPPTH